MDMLCHVLPPYFAYYIIFYKNINKRVSIRKQFCYGTYFGDGIFLKISHLKSNHHLCYYFLDMNSLQKLYIILSATMGSIYEESKDEDGFLYIAYSGENTFGY